MSSLFSMCMTRRTFGGVCMMHSMCWWPWTSSPKRKKRSNGLACPQTLLRSARTWRWRGKDVWRESNKNSRNFKNSSYRWEAALLSIIRIILMNLFWKWMCSIAANCLQEPCTEEPPERTTDEKAPTCQLSHSLAIYHRKHQQENSHWLQHLQWQVWYQKPVHLGFW